MNPYRASFGPLTSILAVVGRKSIVLRALLAMLSCGALIIALTCAGMYAAFARITAGEINQSTQQSLSQAARSLGQVWGALYGQMDREYRTNSALIMAMETPPLNPLDTNRIFLALNEIVASNPAYDSAYVWNGRARLFYSSIGVVQPAESFYDRSALSMLDSLSAKSASFEDRHVLYQSIQYAYGAREHSLDAVTVVFGADPAASALVFNLRQDSLQAVVAPVKPDDGAVTMIVDGSGAVVSHTDRNQLYTNLTDAPYFRRIRGAKDAPEPFIDDIAGRRTLVSYARFERASMLDWYIVRLQDYAAVMQPSRRMLGATVVASALSITLAAAAVTLSLRRIAAPLSRMLLPLAQAPHQAANDDEFGLIAEALKGYAGELEAHRRLDAANLEILRHALLLRLLHGPVADWEARCLAADLPRDAAFTVLALRYSEAGATRLSEAILREGWMDALGDCGVKPYTLPADGVVYVVCAGPMDGQTLGGNPGMPDGQTLGGVLDSYGAQTLDGSSDPPDTEPLAGVPGSKHARSPAVIAHAEAERALGRPVALGASRRASPEHLREAAHAALEASRYSLVYGASCIVYPQDVEARRLREYRYPMEAEAALLAALRGGRSPVDALVAAFLDELRPCALPHIQLALRQFLLSILQGLGAQGGAALPEPERHMANDLAALNARLDALDTLDAVQAYITELCEGALAAQAAVRDARHAEVHRKILDYVERHLGSETLCVQEIADHVGLSASHVRAVFRDAQSCTLSRYIHDRRFALAKQLLRETTLAANQIALQVGYPSANYFYTAFKKAVGMAPEAYRQEGGLDAAPPPEPAQLSSPPV